MPYIDIQNVLDIFESLFRNNENIKSSISCTTHAMDVGALTPFLGIWRAWKAYEFYERVSVLECIQHTLGQEALRMMPIGLLNDIMNF